MKKLTIAVIIVGVALAIFSGIAIWNTIQTENSEEVGSTESSDGFNFAEQTLEAVDAADKHPYELPQNSLIGFVVVFFGGLLMVTIGAYDYYRTSGDLK